MQSPDPYRTPTADVHPPLEGGSDQTPPYSPAGRFGRLSYIAWYLVLSIASQLIMWIFGGGAAFQLPVDPAGVPVPGEMPEISGAALATTLIIGLISMVFGVIFTIRRCHDLDISGWWTLLLIVPLVNLFFALFLLIKGGTEGPNRFGPAREMPGWEKVVGVIGIVLFGLALVGVITAVIIPFLMT